MTMTALDRMEYSSDNSTFYTYKRNNIDGIEVEVLLVGGGGGGSPGGGGGAGGIIHKNHFMVIGQHTITIGAGGLVSSQGENTSFISSYGDNLIAYGGGHGGYCSVGTSGGSGGGRGRDTIGAPPDVIYGQGYKGGSCLQSWYGGAGGGGGAGGVGYNGNYDAGTHPGDNTCKGGPGLEFPQFSSYAGSPAGWFGGGGSGSWENGAVCVTGGIGGGGTNGPRDYGDATAGIANTGGGGGSSNARNPAIGGSGIVIIKYLSSRATASGGTEYTDGDYKIHVFTSSGTFNLISSNEEIFTFSESIIIREGSYSLKCFAHQSSYINKTITRTITTPINLTGHAYIIGYIRSSRTGSNIKIGFHDSGGTTTEVTPNIATADTWQTVQLDISAVSDANKDAIDQVIITVVNADADNTFYLDNFFAVTAADYALGIQASKVVAYAVLSVPEALNVSKVVAYAVLGPYVEPESGSGPMMWIF